MLENQKVALSTLEAVAALIDDAEQLWQFGGKGDYLAFEQHATNMLRQIQNISIHTGWPGPESIADSLKRIMVNAKARSAKILQKIEFELFPLMKEFYHFYYFLNCVYPDRILMEKYFEHDMIRLGANKYLDEAIKTGFYKYDLSIGVLAFNKLEYTKLCVENLLKHIPQDLNYELILINHGSTDGTGEFFERIAPTKQLNILINGGGLGAFMRIIEGKYYLEVTNDVIVTEHAVANMIRCMESDEKIVWVVPTTPNVSNFQTIPAEYKTLDEMHAFARKNNQCSDPYRWEQRTRLCNPISLRRTSVAFSSYGVHWPYYIHTDMCGEYGFIDDKESLFYRRNGYKMMLAKDSYCHHFGSVTVRDYVAKQDAFYEKGCKAFYDAFGIDPWGTGFCWSRELMSVLPCREDGRVNILGINCGIGSNPLKIKESLKENAHNLDVTLYNVTDDERYREDLPGISDVFAYMRQACDVHEIFAEVQFNYIVLESGLEKYSEPLQLVKELKKRLVPGGFMALRTSDLVLKKNIFRNYPGVVTAGDWCVISERRHISNSAYSQYGRDVVFDSSSQNKRQEAESPPLSDGKIMGGHLDSNAKGAADITSRGRDRVPGLASIIIRLSKDLATARKCLQSIREHSPELHEIIFVVPRAFTKVAKWARRQARGQKNFLVLESAGGFAGEVNSGLREASGEFIVILSHECIVTEGWLAGMLECLNSAPDIGIVGPLTNNISGLQKVVNADYGSIENLDAYARLFREKNRYRGIPNRKIVGFCMLFRRELVDRIGLMDESLGTGNFAEDDFCLRTELAGYQNMIGGDVFIHHFGSRNFIGNKIDDCKTMKGSRKQFLEKWNSPDPQSPEGKKYLSLKGRETAKVDYERGEGKKAVDRLLAVIRLGIEVREAYYELAELLLDAKQYDQALRVLKQMPDADQDDRKYALLGYCQEGLANPLEAQKLAEQALSLNSSNALALNLKGILSYRKGDKEEAQNYFQRAAAADPGFGEPHTNLGVIRWEENRKEEALHLLERGFILSPTATDIVQMYHVVITKMGEFARAEQNFREAQALHPFHKRIRFFLIDILLKQGKNDEAMEQIEQSLSHFEIEDEMLKAALEVRKRIGPQEKSSQGQGGCISLCMIVKDEENDLLKCLRSVKPVVDELIVVDTGSMDRTKEIATALGAKVFEFSWENDFSAARNFSISQAKRDWILVLDADEVISPLDHASLLALTKEGSPKAGYCFVTRNYLNTLNVTQWTANDGTYEEEAGSGWIPSDKVRLFPRDRRIHFENPVHEFVEPSMERYHIPIRKCSIPVHHYGKLNEKKLKRKGEDYFLLGKKKLEKSSTDIRSLRELAVQANVLKRYEESAELWHQVIRLQPNSPEPYFNLVSIYMNLGRFQEASDHSKKAIEIDPDCKEAVMNYSIVEFTLGNIKNVISALEGLLSKIPDYPISMALLSVAYILDGEREKSQSLIAKIKKAGFNYDEYLRDTANNLTALGRSEEAGLLLEMTGGKEPEERLPAVPVP
jgi:tetratricopeptide (TPR) repeat protein